MRALLSRESILRPIPFTEPVLFLEARAPGESATFVACHADPPRVVTAGRAFTTIFPPTSDVRVARRHPRPPPCGESSSYAPLSRSRPTYADDLAITDSSNRQLAPPTRSSGSVVFPRRIRREPACQSRTCAPAVKRLRSQGSERLPPYRPDASLHPHPTPPLHS